jgi:hypothetical protein
MLDQWFLDDRAPAWARLEQLQQQERIWFAWLCRLHDVHSGTQTAHSAAVLAVARRRWTEARRAVDRATPDAGDLVAR